MDEALKAEMLYPYKLKLCYFIPVHNESQCLRKNIQELVRFLGSNAPHSKIMLLENGSNDHSYAIAKKIEKESKKIEVRVLSTYEKGYGHAIHMGIDTALELWKENMWYVLTAADLPFGFSDFKAFHECIKDHTGIKILVGSKAHPRSQVSAHGLRNTISQLYYLVRKYVLNMKTKDSQGTIWIDASVAKTLYKHINSRNFFYSTELIYLAEKRGLEVCEMPINLKPSHRKSRVRLFRDGGCMFAEVFRLKMGRVARVKR